MSNTLIPQPSPESPAAVLLRSSVFLPRMASACPAAAVTERLLVAHLPSADKATEGALGRLPADRGNPSDTDSGSGNESAGE